MRTITALVASFAVMISAHASAQSVQPRPISDAALQTKADEACRSKATLASGAIRVADLDGDGQADVLFNWARVTCAKPVGAAGGAGFCGMHNCSVDIYLSSQYNPGDWPKPILNHREASLQILSVQPRALVRISYQGGSCEFAKVCRREWRWDGSKFVSRDLGAGDEPGPPPITATLEVTKANVAGNWVGAADGCATDAVLMLGADGSYAGYEQNGDWRLLGNRIAIMVRETYVLGDAGSTRQVRDPQPVVLTVKSLSSDRMSLQQSSGKVEDYRRCG
ncbi:hypothetical protein [uncultured Erythrobacter sp.]|uniref:hypothetical protein n=1 Tax=uncultured Erythrobacter sp. TaxID=263913 RepID=UPI0026362D6A|nr:hypothetical protein [uncultured Erythrobacter sp.]